MASLKQEWIDALRSGEYTQGDGYLTQQIDEDDDQLAYCCLGVLMEVAHKRGLELDSNPDHTLLVDDDFDGLFGYDLTYVKNDKEAMQYFEEDGINFCPQNYFAHLNDSGSNFNRIAEIIEVLVIDRG